MRILFTGGGTGGHFYPIIAVAEELTALVKEKRLLAPELYYMSPTPYNEGLLFEHGIVYKRTTAGKLRRYFSILNFFDLFKTGWGVLRSLMAVYRLYPDVVFGKGGYASFPVLVAARILRIPVIIHESDSEPGRVNLWAGKFAARIAVSYADAVKYFPAGRVAHTGNPVRKDIVDPIIDGAREYLKLEPDTPVVLFLGGSQGAERINDALIEALPEFVEKFEIIHQTGRNHLQEAVNTSNAVLAHNRHKARYKPFDYLNTLAMRMAAGVASVVVSRAGSTIFEIAAWGKPSIIIPIPPAISHDQTKNAFAYARTGAGEVIEEKNLTPHILLSEITRLVTHPEDANRMSAAAKNFYKPDAARKVAEEILKIALSHEIN
jgi:UDP-N-acetylglucosamine--N-acetylmuramyl-(pentapeptide) pyrophosphoryl-undecaprenol N-acetylglucosamine transferase